VSFEELYSECGAREAALNVAKIMGIDLESATVRQHDAATYPYHDENGNILFWVHRSASKGFRVSRPSADGGVIWNRQGVKLVPYNLPNVLIADTVCICEGEKDCDRLNSLNLADENGVAIVASCNPSGAGKWRDEFTPYFAGKTVIVIADRDEAGNKHAEQVCRSLKGHASSVGRIDFAETEGKDLSDYLDNGHSIDDLVRKLEIGTCKV